MALIINVLSTVPFAGGVTWLGMKLHVTPGLVSASQLKSTPAAKPFSDVSDVTVQTVCRLSPAEMDIESCWQLNEKSAGIRSPIVAVVDEVALAPSLSITLRVTAKVPA